MHGVGQPCIPPKEGLNLTNFTPSRVHLLLQEVYGDKPYLNDWAHLGGGVAEDAVWKRHWGQMAVQQNIWYATPQGVVGRHFTVILTEG